MIMDPYSQYKKQLEYYEYFEKQRQNYTDLSIGQIDQNNSILQFAKILFNKSENNLQQDLSGILIDNNMDTADIFCMLVELILFGLDILTKSKYTVFDLEDSTDEIVYKIKRYLKSSGFDMEVHEYLMDDNIILYRDRDDYYCEIVPKLPSFLCYDGWYILNYHLINNKRFVFTCTTTLDKFKAFFITKQNKIFNITFRYASA